MGIGHAHSAPLKGGCLGKLDARAKILAILPSIFLVNLFDAEHWRAMGVVAVVFAALLALSGRGVWATLKRGLFFLPFVLFVVVTLPFAAEGSEAFAVNLGFTRLIATHEGLGRAWLVAMKSGTSVLGVLVLSGTTEPPELFKGLRALFFPKAFVVVLSMVYRYLFEIGGEFSRIRRAAAARGFEAKSLKALPRMGSMAAALLVRSVVRSERVHYSMQARGYDGEVRTLSETRFGGAEAAFLLAFYAITTTWVILVLNA